MSFCIELVSRSIKTLNLLIPADTRAQSCATTGPVQLCAWYALSLSRCFSRLSNLADELAVAVPASDKRARLTQIVFKRNIRAIEMLEEAGCELEIDTTIHHRAHPIPILAHIFGGVVMMLAAVVTLNPTVQTRYRLLHRIFGYAYIPAAIITGICAVWLTASFPQRFVPLNVVSNFLWGAGLTIFPIIALYFVLNKKIQNHRSWMIRSYALAAGPAMHRLLGFTYIEPVSEIMGGAFSDFCISVMTIVFAELYIRRMRPFRRGL
jgi:hypothetical protein